MKIRGTLLLTLVLLSINLFGANYYWVGGSGSWSNFANHWATTSGGSVFYTQVPQSTDNVFFDANSFSNAGQTVTVDQPVVQCANMTWTGITKTPTFYSDYTNTIKIYGSLVLSTGMTFDFEGPISFEATTTGKTITTAGNLINTSLTFNGIGGSWTLQDALSTGWIFLNNGTLTTNNQTVNAYAFTSTTSSSRTLNMGSSVFNLSFYGSIWEINATGMTMNAGSSTIRGTALSGGAQDFYGAGFTYNDIFFVGTQSGKINGNSTIHDVSFAADGYIQGNCNFHNVTFSANAFLTSNSTYNSATIAQNGDFSSSNVFNNLSLTPGYSYSLTNGTTQTINGNFVANGSCGSMIDIHSSTSGSQAIISKSAGTVSLSYVSLKDINATGGATFTANNTSDLGNNTGWVISALPSKNLYWIGNGGDWNDGNHWSTTSGGAPTGCSPTGKDNVFFDAHSFTSAEQIVNVNVPTVTVNNMNWTGVTNTPTFYGDYSSTLKIYGSLTLVTGMNFNFSGGLYFEATTPGQTLTTAGNLIPTSLVFNGIGGSWTLQDVLSSSYWIYLNNGILNTNNQTVNAYAFTSTSGNTRTINMGSSVFNLAFNGFMWEINPTGMTVNAGTSIINGIGASGGEQDFYGGGFTYNNIFFIGSALGKVLDSNHINDVNFSFDGFIQGGNFHDVNFAANAVLYNNNICNNVKIGKNGDMYGNNTFNSLTLTPGYTYTLADGSTQSINSTLAANGSCGAMIDIKSSTGGHQANIVKTSGTVAVSFVSLKDINVSGGATFTADNALDLTNNGGWAINPMTAKNLYWVGNGGNWHDGNHWSTTSGGAPSGCPPNSNDNVFFDAHSFSTLGQTVVIDIPTAVANNMSWVGVSNSPTFYGDYSNTLKLSGSLSLSSQMVLDFTGSLVFAATAAGQTITTAGNVINTSITFDGIGGSWSLQDALNCNYWVYLNNGTLNTNNKIVNIYSFNSTTATTRALNMGSSVFNLSFNGLIWNVNPTGLTVNAGTSTINGTGVSGGEQDFYGGGFTYNNIFFVGSALGKIIDNNTINDVSFASDGFIQGGSFHDVTFSGNAVLYNDNICNNVSIAKDGDFLGSNTFNYLKLSPGYTYTFTSGEIQTIMQGGNICAQGTGSLPIRIQSSLPGVPSAIFKTSGTVCWDYVRLSDIAGTGGAIFNAGLAPTNSQDMGGSTGFLFTGGCYVFACSPCIPTNISNSLSDISVCSGAGVVYSVSATGTGLSYQWQVNQGSGFVDLTNNSNYTGVITNSLAIASATSLLNGYQYRCVVNSSCAATVISNMSTLTVNPLPTATTVVNGLAVTVAATGGTAPYSGTGLFTVLTAGTYPYTIIDAKGCTASTTANVVGVVSDIIPPVAICKTATLTLVNGSATLSASAVNNGSYDNVGVASVSVSPSTFTCANTGANTVTLTVKDLAGNVATCQTTVTVIGSAPAIVIATPVNNASTCVGSNAAFTTMATGTSLSYQWQVNPGSGFINLVNNSIYSGVGTNNLAITSATTALNGYQYRCVINGACLTTANSNVGTLTVNSVPIATATVNGSSVTVAATGGVAPYTGIGTFSGLTVGTYTYTVTDAKGCAATVTANVTVSSVDNIPPTAICKTAVVTLVNGSATLAASAVNNGSYDNVGVTSVTVSPSTFTCANIGVNTVTLTVKDLKGNTATCQTTITVQGTIPTVSISQTGLSGFSQGSGAVLNAMASSGVSYLWNTGETTSSKNVSTSGVNSITVTNSSGCKATASTTVGASSASSLSSYTIIVQDEVELKNYSMVQSGGVGATTSNGEVELQNHSYINGATTFAQAKYISINNYSTIQTKTYAPAVVSLPVYKTNTYCAGNYGNCHHTCSYSSNNSNGNGGCSNNSNYASCYHHCDGSSVNCSHSGKNKNCNNNSALNMTDSVYGNITIGDYTTVTFTKPVVYLKNLMVGAHSTIVFAGCTELKICGEVNLGDYTIFNSDAKMVVVYADGNVHVGKGNSYTGVIYCKGNLITSGTSSTTTSMKGMFIANSVESNYTTWNWNTIYTNCSSTRMLAFEEENTTISSGDFTSIAYPNPSMETFNLLITSSNTATAVVRVFDVMGREVFIKNDVEINTLLNFGSDLKAGVYIVTISQDNENKTLRIIKQSN